MKVDHFYICNYYLIAKNPPLHLFIITHFKSLTFFLRPHLRCVVLRGFFILMIPYRKPFLTFSKAGYQVGDKCLG